MDKNQELIPQTATSTRKNASAIALAAGKKLTFCPEAERRGLSALLDLVISTAVALIPFIYQVENNVPLEGSGAASILNALKVTGGVGILSLALALTPFPMIYLRLVFKNFMQSPTPGEKLVGIAVFATDKNYEAVIRELLFALAQYMITTLAIVAGLIAPALIGAVLQHIGLPVNTLVDNIYVDAALLVVWFFVLIVVSTRICAFFFQPLISDDRRSWIDYILKLTVGPTIHK